MSRSVERRGIVLIFVAGILTILAAMGMAFFSLTQSSTMSSVRYMDMVRADLLARAGMQEAAARLRQMTYLKTEDPADPWYTTDWLHNANTRISLAFGDGKDNDSDGIVDNESGETPLSYSRALGSTVGDNSDRYTLEIEDAASKINVNACDNLAVVLDNLCRLIGPPLVAANDDMLQPRRWYIESQNALAAYNTNTQDTEDRRDLYYTLDGQGRPVQAANGIAVYGDGYAIAGYRARSGPFGNLEMVKQALTYVERNGNGIPDDLLETMEIEVKFAALRPHITTDSWVDTNTVCVGKFEWVKNDESVKNVMPLNGTTPQNVNCQILIDRDKSWVADKPNEDPLNQRGSLRGSWVSIINGHGSGQLRRIATNGTDWIAIRCESPDDERMTVYPGPISSYMIMAREDALLDQVSLPGGRTIHLPRTYTNPAAGPVGQLVDDPKINYKLQPLCIHRAPVNINTASDKVLAALFMGINLQHGHPMAIGTDADLLDVATEWKMADLHGKEGTLLTTKGLKRTPVNTGKLVFNRPAVTADADLAYLDNHGTLNGGQVNEALELAHRIIQARQTRDHQGTVLSNPEPLSGYPRGPFHTWDDLYFRIIRPWDETRFAQGWVDGNANGIMDSWVDKNGNKIIDAGEVDFYHTSRRARMLMAQFNSNTDILKFNPNIEWIDRWGRNFTEMEPVMVYTNQAEPHSTTDIDVCGTTNVAGTYVPWTDTSRPIYARESNLREFGDSNANYGYYVTRSFRYKSDELVDKTDLNRSTTEFSFDSNGIYSINCTGQVIMPITGQTLAERKFESLIQVYDVWRESTQAQFVNGTISEAANQAETDTFDKFNYSGTIARDAKNGFSGGVLYPGAVKRLALNTLPEPLVPLAYRLTRSASSVGTNAEEVDVGANGCAAGKRRDAFGDNTVDLDVPDVVANRVLPALYDGQLVLATNTSRYNPATDQDSFLVSFNGDLDSTTSAYNGREQAKTPSDCKVRVVDTFGLLGIPNDTMVDTDPDLPLSRKVYKFSTVASALKGLDPTLYWNNCSVRMGDLRADGVFLSGPGVAGRDATLKYLYGPNKENLNPGSTDANCISLWFKPTWRQSDNRHHELFNGSNVGNWWESRQLFLCKAGRYCWAVGEDGGGSGLSGSRARRNDLLFALEGVNSSGGYVAATNTYNSQRDRDCDAYLHGGVNRVPSNYLEPANPNPESPKYRVQPFRWHFAGARWNYHQTSPVPDVSGGSKGHWVAGDDYANPTNVKLVTHFARCFIDSQWDPEGRTAGGAVTWKPTYYWERHAMYRVGYLDRPCDLADTGAQSLGNGSKGTDVKYDWAHPSGSAVTLKCFGLNNLNYNNNAAIYRYLPEDGTYAVIDELKISNKDRILYVGGNAPDWGNDRIAAEQTLSRYYLPASPGSRSQCPTFTSQTLLQSIRGFDQTSSATGETVTVARVHWNVFTPRFMHEYKTPGTFKRDEYVYRTYPASASCDAYGAIDAHTSGILAQKDFKGPFDFVRYNNDVDTTAYSVNRPHRSQYPGGQAHASKGVEVELLDDTTPLAAKQQDNLGVWQDAQTNPLTSTNSILTNPDMANRFGDPTAPVRVRTDRLRYRVRFIYPVDPLVDPAGGNTVNPTNHYLLDTPVFDDISVTYFTRLRFMYWREVTE